MKMKKFLAALLATGLVLSTVGCGSSDSGSEGSSTSQQTSNSAGSESGTESSATAGNGNVTDGNYGGLVAMEDANDPITYTFFAR